MRGWFLLAGLALAGSAANAKGPTPLFASDAPIHLTIQGPMSTLASNRNSGP